jgi:cytochrome c-type biogenesis protein CcmH
MKRMLQHKRPLLVTFAVVAIVAAIWSYAFLQNSPQQTLDKRAHDVASQLKCPICQGESVADSPSALAQQMRGVIRQQLQAGKSEQEVIQYFQNSYGNSIVWSPPWQGFTLLAWLAPIGLSLAGLVVLFFILRDWQMSSALNSTAHEVELAGTHEDELIFEYTQLVQELTDEDPILQEIELDYQLGNITEADYRSLREKYLHRSLVALKSRYDREQELDTMIEERLGTLKENNDDNGK